MKVLTLLIIQCFITTLINSQLSYRDSLMALLSKAKQDTTRVNLLLNLSGSYETVLNFMSSKEYESTLLANETIEATVAFIDICSFTAISETQPANEVVNLLNNYFDVMVKEIIAQDGYIDKFIGDAVMAVFRGDYHLDRAIEACLAVRKRIESLPEYSEGFSAKVSIGVNSGEVISGNIGSANLKRLDYTVIGDVVNVAQRLQTAALESQIMITEDSYKKIKESFNCKGIGEVSLKNKAASMMAYEVIN